MFTHFDTTYYAATVNGYFAIRLYFYLFFIFVKTFNFHINEIF